MSTSHHSILLRYGLLLLFGIGNLFIIYLFVTPLTVYPVFWFIDMYYGAELLRGTHSSVCAIAENYVPFLADLACMNTTIFFQGYFASIIPACVAGAAYYFLLILNLSTPMSKRQRVGSLVFLLGSFLILNIIRIFAFALIYVNKGFEAFNTAHVATWYFGSTVLVVLLWFSNVLIFNIHKVPVYSDIKHLIKLIRPNK